MATAPQLSCMWFQFVQVWPVGQRNTLTVEIWILFLLFNLFNQNATYHKRHTQPRLDNKPCLHALQTCVRNCRSNSSPSATFRSFELPLYWFTCDLFSCRSKFYYQRWLLELLNSRSTFSFPLENQQTSPVCSKMAPLGGCTRWRRSADKRCRGFSCRTFWTSKSKLFKILWSRQKV